MRGFKRFKELVDALMALPTIGRKSAVRLAFYLVRENTLAAMKLAHAIESAVREIGECTRCGGISENEICEICTDEGRDRETLCVVENPKDIMVIEESGEYNGLYFVLESFEEDMEKLASLVEEGSIKEIVFALTPSVANDALILHVEERLKNHDIAFTKIAQGVPTGVSLENVDALSLGRALNDRVKV